MKPMNPPLALFCAKPKIKCWQSMLCEVSKKPIGVSDYELTRALPDDLKSSLPSIEELEAQLLGKVRG